MSTKHRVAFHCAKEYGKKKPSRESSTIVLRTRNKNKKEKGKRKRKSTTGIKRKKYTKYPGEGS